jgi:hypothetical protein
MYNGDFFDASAYKADPVPMALDSGTVYEAMRSGISQGLFTIKDATETGTTWAGRGKWQNSATLAAIAAARKKKAEEKPPTLADDDKGPPKLLRRSSKSKPATPSSEPPKTNAPAQNTPSSAPSSTAPASSQPSANAPSQSAPAAEAKPSSPSASAPASTTPPSATPAPLKPDSAEVEGEEDPDRPRLEREKEGQRPTHSAEEKPGTPSANAQSDTKPAAAASIVKDLPLPNIQEIPAISDAGGPEARSYLFPLKAGEAEQFRKKMLLQATQVLRAQIKLESAGAHGNRTTRLTAKGKAGALAEPSFQDVQLRIFDLSSSNQPLMVLEAAAQIPGRTEPQHITLVTREDINGELHNALANITDSKNLDAVAQMDLIDVVDADGDGRGELLFRETSDQGHAYSIYRVIGDQLYQLYESTPQ